MAFAIDATAYTNKFTGTITFLPKAFVDPTAGREVTSTLMHELNNLVHRSHKYDDFCQKGSYTAESVGYRAWDATYKKKP